jgi:hypothetical protein
VLYYFNSQEQTHILDLDLDFGSDKIAADADMDDNSDEEPAILPGKGKKPMKESARSSIAAARAISALKGNHKAALPESDSDLEIIDIQGKCKAADIGRMRQVHSL